MTTTDQGAQPSAQEGTSRRKLNDPYFLIRQQCGCLSAALPDRVGDEKEIGAVLVDAMREGRFVTRVVLVAPVTIGGRCEHCDRPAGEQAHGA